MWLLSMYLERSKGFDITFLVGMIVNTETALISFKHRRSQFYHVFLTDMSYWVISINLFVVYRIFTSMIGKKTNVPLVKKDLRDHKVIYLYMITCSFLFYPNMA